MNSMKLIQRINFIANNYNCRTVLIDFDNFTINIEGREDQRTACMIDIKKQLGEYLAVPPGFKTLSYEQQYITTLYGWPV